MHVQNLKARFEYCTGRMVLWYRSVYERIRISKTCSNNSCIGTAWDKEAKRYITLSTTTQIL